MATWSAPWRRAATRGRIRSDEPLARHTSLRVGGPADWFAEPEDVEALQALIEDARQAELPTCIIGGGTNLLAPDRGFRGLAIHLRGPAFSQIVLDDPRVSDHHVRLWCGGATVTNRLVDLAAREGWAGAERLAGLPGSVAGAVAGNAQEIGAFVEALGLIADDGGLQRVERSALRFAYRHADLPAGLIVRVQLAFERAPSAEVAAGIAQALGRRKATQELDRSSAGCAFKNPVGSCLTAGALIDRSGLKGAAVGEARVSQRHANFIVNLGRATAWHVIALMERMQTQVHRDHGVWLEPELRLLAERLAS